MNPTIDTIKTLIANAGKSFTGASWDTGPDMVVSALERGDTKRASEPDSGLDVPNDGSMQWGGLRQRWIDLLRDCEHSDGSNVSDLLAEAEAIRDENHDYVVECADECEGYGAEAIKALDLGMIDEAIAMLENAVTVERTFGDAPSWGEALNEAISYSMALADADEDATRETGDELTAAEVEALGWPVRFERDAQANEPDAMNPDALHIYVNGAVVACYPDSNHYYATMDAAREHYAFRDVVPATPNEAWDRAMGFQSVHEAVANDWDPKVCVNMNPTCKDLTCDEREAVAALLARHIAAQG